MLYALDVMPRRCRPGPLFFGCPPRGGPRRMTMRIKTWTDDQAAEVYSQCDAAQTLLDGVLDSANENDLETSRHLMQILEQFLGKMLRVSSPTEVDSPEGPKENPVNRGLAGMSETSEPRAISVVTENSPGFRTSPLDLGVVGEHDQARRTLGATKDALRGTS